MGSQTEMKSGDFPCFFKKGCLFKESMCGAERGRAMAPVKGGRHGETNTSSSKDFCMCKIVNKPKRQPS